MRGVGNRVVDARWNHGRRHALDRDLALDVTAYRLSRICLVLRREAVSSGAGCEHAGRPRRNSGRSEPSWLVSEMEHPASVALVHAEYEPEVDIHLVSRDFFRIVV